MSASFQHSSPPIATPLTVAELTEEVQHGSFGPPPSSLKVTVAFLTFQRSCHQGRRQIYTNYLVSLRAGNSVGCCFFEPGEIDQPTVDACLGQSLDVLLNHPMRVTRVAALDAYLNEVLPHHSMPGARTVVIPGGSSIAKSEFRARWVVQFLGVRPGQRVVLIGLVNSLAQAIRQAGGLCLPCNLNAAETEWGEPVAVRMEDVLVKANAILATGMTLANGSFDHLLLYSRQHGVPLVVFAQTGSAIVPRFLGAGVTAVSSEPYPFFWMTGGPTVIYGYSSSREE